MVENAILKEIRDELKRGFKVEEIKQHLLSRGHADYDIDLAITEIAPAKPVYLDVDLSGMEEEKPEKKEVPKIDEE